MKKAIAFTSHMLFRRVLFALFALSGTVYLPRMMADDAAPKSVEVRIEKKEVSEAPGESVKSEQEKAEPQTDPAAGAPFVRARMTHEEMVRQWDGLEATREDGTTVIFSSGKQDSKPDAAEKEMEKPAPSPATRPERTSAEQKPKPQTGFERGIRTPASSDKKETKSDGKTNGKTPDQSSVPASRAVSSPEKE